MGHLDHAAFGWLTPVLSYATACVGAALGLRCTVRALDATGRSRRNRLLTATAALWAALHIHAPAAAAVASLVMGAAVSSMHYTGVLAVSVEVTPSGAALPGATVMRFVFPLAVGLGSYLFTTAAFVALSPTAGERAAGASAGRPTEPDGPPADIAPPGPRPVEAARTRTRTY
ncbi:MULTISPECIES: hypothetical protein [unclassified Streptomyces]|uniref:hypothetical protein n=1 Tax=unclassified Streptomyces TaxID=2593676 RepID=UPI0033BA7805